MSESNASGQNSPSEQSPTPADPAQTTTTDPAPQQPEAKPAEGEAAEPLTAEAIKLPEGFEAHKESLDSFVGIMNDANLTPAARAQALVDLQAKIMQDASAKGSELWSQTQEKWANDVRALPKIGGDALPQTLGAISRLIDETLSKEDAAEVRQVMDITGAGNHPAMVKLLHAVATKLVIEGKPVSGSPAGTGQRDPADILYPNQGR